MPVAVPAPANPNLTEILMRGLNGAFPVSVLEALLDRIEDRK